MTTEIFTELKGASRNTWKFFRWILLLILAGYFCLGFYQIKTEEQGVLTILGKATKKRVLPGLHYTLPWPFAKIYKVPVQKAHRFVIDDFYQGTKAESRASKFKQLTGGLDSYCLSGDNNAIEIQLFVQYRIYNPFDYLFANADQGLLLRDIICNEIIHLLASRPVDLVLTTGKNEIKDLLQLNAQKKLDDNQTGLRIDRIDIYDIRPPASVQAAFDDVINARIDMKKLISRAQSYRTEEVSRAEADADRIIKEAQSYQNQVVANAAGRSERFREQLRPYRKYPEITARRLYLEFARECLNQITNLYLLDTARGEAPAHIRIFSGQ